MVVDQTTAAISIVSKYLKFCCRTSRKLTFFKQDTYPHLVFKKETLLVVLTSHNVRWKMF